jgi:prepilin-type N-terminal cleavage/methylation domain-containing protein
MRKKGFTLMEIIIVLGIIVILASLVAVSLIKAKESSRLARISTEMTEINVALTQYAEDNNYAYPPDVDRSVPPGLEKYLKNGVWPTSVWPHGVFDWDNWTTVNGVASPQIYQITYHLCGISDPIEYCSDPLIFPHFTRNSSIFYCIQGPCVPHQNAPTDPGYCVNCKPKEVNPPL